MQKRVKECAHEELEGYVKCYITEGDMKVKQIQIVALSPAVLHTRSSEKGFYIIYLPVTSS